MTIRRPPNRDQSVFVFGFTPEKHQDLLITTSYTDVALEFVVWVAWLDLQCLKRHHTSVNMATKLGFQK